MKSVNSVDSVAMRKLRSCPRCGGDVFLDGDVYGWYEQCLDCAYMHDLQSIDEFGEVAVERANERTVAGIGQRRAYSRAASPTALTTREREVLELVSGGLSNREIADKLFVSENTIKTHLRNIMDKYDFKNRAQAAAYIARSS